MDLQAGVALVTGGASGLGRATAERLTAAGANVVIVDLPSSNGARLATAMGKRVRFAPADVTDTPAVERALEVAAALGQLRVLVNCAGTGEPQPLLSRGTAHPIEAFERIMAINLTGTFNVLRLAVGRMAEHDVLGGERGIVINTGSIAAFDGQAGQAAYAASKSGVTGMTLPLARELAPLAIRVVTVAPGFFDTPLVGVLSKRVQDAVRQEVVHPSRLGAPAEFAALVEHIVANPMINGEVLRIDGAVRIPHHRSDRAVSR